jgi:excinuclease ABC subunit A
MGEGEHTPLLSARQRQIGALVLKEIRARLQFMLDVGLDYLTLHRTAMTLSGVKPSAFASPLKLVLA